MNPDSILDHYDRGTLWPASADVGTDLDAAYQGALALRALRIGRGERPVGYKIGFTNRTIWDRYQVFAPIWGPVWNTTLAFCDGDGRVDLAATCQPRIEPEVVFGMAATPPHDPSLEDLYACIAWVAPGFEIVQSHRPDWKFTAADTVSDGALHARLLVGPTTPIVAIADSGEALDRRLATTRLVLHRSDTRVDSGTGANVLDGPLHALLHFVRALQSCPGAPDLQPGEVVTTGTWTDAWPIERGQRWHASFDSAFPGLAITLV